MRSLALLLLAAAAGAQDLAALVDRDGAEARRKAARELARDDAVPLDAWLEAMRGFGPRAGEGAQTRVVDARLDGGLRCEIAVHVPESAKRPAPCLLALHGAGGHGLQEVHRWGPVADALGMIVVAPTEPAENAGYRFTADERAAALAALRWARRRFDVDENRIHVAGVSRGGHLAWDLALRHPDVFASAAPMIGGPRLDPSQGHNNLRFLENLAHLPLRDLQGEDDDPLLLFNLRLAFARLEKLGAKDARLVTFPGVGHGFGFEAVAWEEFLSAARRDPRPPRVVRLSAGGEGRAFWVEILETDRAVREKVVPQVRAAQWSAMDDRAKRLFLAAEADRRTARLEAEWTGPGSFTVESTGVRAFRLLLDASMFDPEAPVRVEWNGRARTRTLRPGRRVALEEFAERFDRTFVPVAELRVP